MPSDETYGFSTLSEKTRTSNRCKCHYKGNTFSSVILRPWMLVRPRFEPARPLPISRNGARRLQRTEFILDNIIDHFHSRGQQLCTVLGSLYPSGKLPTYPTPEPTLTLTFHLGQNVEFNSHRRLSYINIAAALSVLHQHGHCARGIMWNDVLLRNVHRWKHPNKSLVLVTVTTQR